MWYVFYPVGRCFLPYGRGGIITCWRVLHAWDDAWGAMEILKRGDLKEEKFNII